MGNTAVLVETEIKLRIPPELSTRICEHPLVTERLRDGWRVTELFNQYYDSPDLALDRADLALRLRRDGDQFIQTLKGRGNSVAGLSVRNEWDWYMDNESLSLSALHQAELPAVLNEIDLNRLQPLFRTDFTRTRGALCWQFQGEEVEIELALDAGQVLAEQRSEPLSELELELRRGPQKALLAFAVALAAELPLQPWDSAKAERGYRLIDPNRSPALPALCGWSLDTDTTQLVLALTERLAARAVCWSERLYLNDENAAQGLLDTLSQLGSLLALLAVSSPFPEESVPAQNIVKVKATIDTLQGELSTLDRTDLPAFRRQLETDPRWGWIILTLAQMQLYSDAPADAPRADDWLESLKPCNAAEADLIRIIREASHD